MKNICIATVFLLSLFGCRLNEQATEPICINEHMVLAVNWFQKSAEMKACYYQAYNLAELKMKEHFANYKGIKPTAVVLDIDETVLDNSPYTKYLIDSGNSYSPITWKMWTDKASAKALPGALEFTLAAQKMGVQVIYISNRKTVELDSTIRNLVKEGFPNADTSHVFLHNPEKSGDKTDRRAKVMATFEVLLLLGDNLTDFDQLFADRDSLLGFNLVNKYQKDFGNRFIIFPNPLYGEWESAIYKNNYSISSENKKAMRLDILDGF